MVALDPGFRAGDEFLRDEFKASVAQLRPQATQNVDVLRTKRLAQSEAVVPAIEPGQRLDDQRKTQTEIGGFEDRRIETPGRRHRQAVAFGQHLEARLVEKILDQGRIGNDETECRRQAFAEPRDEEDLAVLFIEEHRRFGLRLGESDERVDQAFGVVRIVIPDEARLRVARIERRNPRPADDGARNARQRQRPQQIHIAHDASQRRGRDGFLRDERFVLIRPRWSPVRQGTDC